MNAIAALLLIIGQCYGGSCGTGSLYQYQYSYKGPFRSYSQSLTISNPIIQVSNTENFRSVVIVQSGSSKGTGVVIRWGARSVLLTAAHVIENAGKVVLRTVDGILSTCRVIHIDKTRDFAICVPENANLTCTKIAADNEDVAAGNLHCVGYSRTSLMMRSGIFKRFTSYQSNEAYGNYLLEITGGAQSGWSGGPIFNSNGNVVGIISTADNSYTYGAHISVIRVVLNKYFSNFEPPPLPTPQEQPENAESDVQQDENSTVDDVVQAPLNLVPIQQAIASLDKRVTSLEMLIDENGLKGEKGDPGPQGERGPQGEQGPQGLPGQPGTDAELNYQMVVDEVIAKLPPVKINLVDSQGNVAASLSAKLGTPVNLPPVKLRTLDADGGTYQEAEAPLGQPLGLKSKFFSTSKGQ